MKKLDLNASWNFSMGEYAVITDLPTSNFVTLLKEGMIKDPFYRTNEKSVLFVAENDCVFEKEFILAENYFSSFDRIILFFERIDCISDIYFNDEHIAHTENAHMFYEFDVTDKIAVGKNIIRVKLYSPLKFIADKQKEKHMPKNPNGFDGASCIRKPNCHFGWDWGIGLPPSGLENVSLMGYKKIKLNTFDIHQKHQSGEVTLSFSASYETFSQGETTFCENGELKKKLSQGERTTPCQIGESINKLHSNESINPCKNEQFDLFVEISDGEFSEKVAFAEKYNVLNPVLWWCNGLSGKKKPKLYTITLTAEKGGEVFDSVTKKIGLRTIRLDRSVDGFGEDFCFILNGVKIFAKGANWIPIDAFITRRTKEDYLYYIESAYNANMNMLRVWGGGYYESETFYDLCDEYGILVWQDFAFACMPFPFNEPKFFANVIGEVQQNIIRLRNRTCLALLCGNNEIEAMTAGWANRQELIKWTYVFFYRAVKNEVCTLAPQVSYIPGSPVGKAFLKKVGSDAFGDTHLWQVWHGLRDLTYYRKRLSRFCSEFGLQSLPSMTAIKTFAEEEEDFSLRSNVMKAHQKCGLGNEKMLYYLMTRFHLPKHFEDYPYLTGLTQKECVADASEHWRRNGALGGGPCNGALYWQYNDNWTVSSWSSVDFTGKFKPLHYHAKHIFAPISVSLQNNKTIVDIYLLNDSLESKTLTLAYGLVQSDGEIKLSHEEEVTIEKLSVKKFKTVSCAKFERHLKNCIFYAKLLDNGKEIVKKTALFGKDKALKLSKDPFTYEVEVKEGKTLIKLYAKSYARAVCIDYHGSMPLSDNYFDLLPKEEKTVEIPEEVPPDEITVTSLASVEFCTCVFKRLFLKIRILLTPKIWAFALAYLFM